METDRESVDTSRARIHKLHSIGCADYLHLALLDRAEAAEAELAQAKREERLNLHTVTAYEAGFEAGQVDMRERAAKEAEALDPEKPTNWLHRREHIPAAIRAMKAKLERK